MIYAIQAKGTKFVKFGVAKNVGKRLMAHQVSCPHELVILAAADWPNWAEALIHNRLRLQCVRGEWFEYRGVAVRIVELMLAGEPIGALRALPSDSSQFVQRRMERIIDHALKLSGAE